METIDYAINSKEELAFACMPFIKNGGLFIKTNVTHRLGTYLTINLKLLDDPVLLNFAGKVVWIIPKNEQTHMPEGIGVQFTEENLKAVRDKIEAILPDAFSLAHKTDFILDGLEEKV